MSCWHCYAIKMFELDVAALQRLPSRFAFPEKEDFAMYGGYLLCFLLASFLVKGDEALGQPLKASSCLCFLFCFA